MMAEHRYRPFALILSDRADQRDRDCCSLSDKGYDVLRFADAEDAEGWLEEETPEVAIVDEGADPLRTGIVETLTDRGVILLRTG
ncbi:hypothetical protein ACLBX9_16535 [Methylobacterium sp. A49B]